MTESAQVGLDSVREWIGDRPFMKWMGLQLDELERDRVVLSLDIEPHMRYIQGMLHGGLTCVLLDTAIGIAARLQVPADRAVRTTLLETRYLAPGRGARASVEGAANLVGGVIVGVGTVSIDGREVAAGRGEFAVVHRDRRTRETHRDTSNDSVAGG